MHINKGYPKTTDGTSIIYSKTSLVAKIVLAKSQAIKRQKEGIGLLYGCCVVDCYF